MMGVPLIIYYFCTIIFGVFKEEKTSKLSIYSINLSLILFDALFILLIINSDIPIEGLETNSMFILFSPFLVLLTSMYLVNNILKFKKGNDKINIVAIVCFIIISIFLTTFYFPKKHIINTPMNEIFVQKIYTEKTDEDAVFTTEPEKVDKIVEVLNKYTFRRSLLVYKPFSTPSHDRICIRISSDSQGVNQHFYLYIFDINGAKSVTLDIDGSLYSVNNERKLIKEMLALVDDYEKDLEPIENNIKMWSDQETYTMPLTFIKLNIEKTGFRKIYIDNKCILEQYAKDHWEAIKDGEITFNDFNYASYALFGDRKYDFYVPLPTKSNTFKAGKYRIIKNFKTAKGEFNVTCEFNLE
jgi:hypothetical protein